MEQHTDKKYKEVGKMIIDISSIFLGETRSCLALFSHLKENVKLMPQQVANPADIRMGFNF